MKPTNPAKINLHNIKRFIQGYWRYLLFKFSVDGKDLNLLSKYKQEQFKWRLRVMNPECLNNKKCVICGCETPYLQMSDEACEGSCYPAFMSKEEWKDFKKENQITI